MRANFWIRFDQSGAIFCTQKLLEKTKSILLAATQVFNFKPEHDNDESSLTNLAVGKCSLQNKLDVTTKRLPKLAEDK